MAILLNQSFPTEMLDTLLKVTEEIGVRDDPPEGLIVHTIVQRAEGLQVVDVWDSKEQYDSFLETQLMPGFAKVAEAQGQDPQEVPLPPDPDIEEIKDIVRGRQT
ncbi:MAG: hypothetical protein M3P01_07835 [Actinomycetota bacterium]|nr:hypothetical protein [Actinomycetota bacterium]